MNRVVLIHWKASEAEERVERLRRAGFEAEFLMPEGGTGLRRFRQDPPGAFVIDLSRLPSHGRAVAIFLRQQKATRHMPLVFVDGEPGKVAVTRQLLPDANYTDWSRIGEAIRRATERVPAKPVVPATMAGYSGTPLPKKLGFRPNTTAALLGAPDGFEAHLKPLPENVRFEKSNSRGSSIDLILLFAKSQAALARRFPSALRRLADRGSVWILWPKKASGLQTDLGEAAVRTFGLSAGLVDYKVCAVDATWSGLLFTRWRGRRAS